MGNGTYDNPDMDLYYGKTSPDTFQDFMSKLPDDILKYAGKYLLKQDGIPCKIMIKFYGDKETVIYEISYGSQFEGLADEIRNIIATAIRLTDDWYLEQQDKPKAQEIPKK